MHAALRLLTRREYSEQELSQRLLKTYAQDEVNEVIAACKAQRLLSDERFVESRLRHRISQGYGPRFIQQDLSQHGICQELIATHLTEDDDFWVDNAHRLLQKKYRDFNAAAKMKAQRYLYQRGFSGSQIQAALRQVLTVKE